MKKFLIILALTLYSFSTKASDDLLYLEVQGIAGYSSSKGNKIYFSQHPKMPLQKNSVGFDYIKKLSNQNMEIGTAALQMRLAYDEPDNKTELQIHNAYLKGKTQYGNIWTGHERIAFGLASYWDTHGDLMQPLTAYGFSFNRDWGLGYSKDSEKGDVNVSLSTGSGMPLRTHGNHILTARTSYGVLNNDNYNIGLSIMTGKTIDTMGNEIINNNPKNINLIGLDFAYNYLNFEHKAEIVTGEKSNQNALGLFYRFGINFLEENRLKLEAQTTYTEIENIENKTFSIGTSYLVTSNLTSRVMFERNDNQNDNRIVFQLYYYFGV